MPIKQEFNISNYKKNDFINLIKEELTDMASNVTYANATISSKSFNVYSIKISEEDLEEFINSDLATNMLEKKYNESYLKKKEQYDKLKEKLDYCLHDVKIYKKLIKNIDELTYCSAISELQRLEKKYLKSKAVSYVIYRARNQEYNKISCN